MDLSRFSAGFCTLFITILWSINNFFIQKHCFSIFKRWTTFCILRPHCCSLHSACCSTFASWRSEGQGVSRRNITFSLRFHSGFCSLFLPFLWDYYPNVVLGVQIDHFWLTILRPHCCSLHIVAAYLPECHGDRALQGEIFSHVYPYFLMDFVLSSSFWGVLVTFFHAKAPCYFVFKDWPHLVEHFRPVCCFLQTDFSHRFCAFCLLIFHQLFVFISSNAVFCDNFLFVR